MNRRQKEVQQTFLNSEKAVLKALEKNYQDALNEIDNKIAELQAREDADLQHVIYQIDYQRALKSQVQTVLDQLHNRNFGTLSEYLTSAYEDGFIGTMYDLQGQGIPLVFPIDQAQVAAAIQHGTKLSESLYSRLGKDTSVLSRQIAGEISRGITNASMYSDISRNISDYCGISKNKAMRIARTESHRIQCKATADAQHRAKEKGADVVKQWDSSLDGKTRETHRELDGQIRELDDPFEVQGMKAMQPGGFGIPSEDCNCRCALLQRARWALGNDYTKWSPDAPVLISDDGTTQFTVLKEKNYQDFKDKYQKAAEEVRVRSSAQKMNQEDTIDYAARRKERMAARNAERAKREMKHDFSAMSASEIRNFAENSLNTEFVGMEGANNDFIRDAVKIIDSFERKNGGTIEGLKVQFGGTPSGVFAKYDDKTNTLILKKTGSIKAFEQKQIEDNLRYKLKWKKDKDYYATTTYSGTVAHELGHAVDFSTGQALSKALSSTPELDELSVKISSYAASSQGVRVSKRSEAWAENFAAYMEGGSKAKEVPLEIVEMIEGYFKKETLENTVKSGKIKSNLQFFAEKDIKNQESNSLKRAIRKYQKRIDEHNEKIKNPEKYIEDWESLSSMKQEGLKKHWKKEIRNFNNSIDDRVAELKERGDFDE